MTTAVWSGYFTPVYPALLPWKAIFEDMRERGVSYYRQAMIIGVGWSTFQRWLEEGAEPRHSYAVAILSMHTSVCGEPLTQARYAQAIPRA
jgi:hypothetical protein